MKQICLTNYGGFDMTVGDRIKKARNAKGLTQKDLGVAIGFTALTADVRIAQYESGTRVPKEKVLFDLSRVLSVSLEYLSVPSFVTSKDVMLALMEFDDYNEAIFGEVEYINSLGEPMKHTGIFFNRADLESQLAEWAVVKKQLADGIISVEEYDKWKTNWPATSAIYTSEPIKWKT